MAERSTPRSLDALLEDERLIDAAGLREARRTALRMRTHLVEVLTDEHVIDEGRLADVLCRRLGLPRARIGTVDDEAVRELPHDLAAAHLVVPLTVLGDHPRTLTLAMVNPLDADALRDVTESTGCLVEVQVATVGEVRLALPRFYSGMITRMIPRVGQDGRMEPSTQPHLELPDERSLELRLRALVDLLVERGVLASGDFEERVRRLARGEDV
ncbi:MAG: hypothetical protein ABI321_18150 [Polyangia bacterium]